MLKNVQHAKFENILLPITQQLIHKDQRALVAFEPFFTHILCHELLHGLGPHTIQKDGRQVPVRLQLQELHSAIEEAKADICGLFAVQYLVDKGVIDKALEKSFYVTFLAGAFRSIRFGLEEAHGIGQAVQLNYLLDQKGFVYDDASGTFSVNFSEIRHAVNNLCHNILTLQAEGSKEKAKQLLETYGITRPHTVKALAAITKIPVDIFPIFPSLEG